MAVVEAVETAPVQRLLVCFGSPAACDESGVRHVPGHAGRLMLGLISRPKGATLDDLQEIVWPDASPKSARAALHVHLGNLRRVLGDAPHGPRVVRSGAGYRIDLGAWTTDIELFDAARRRAAEIARSDPATATALIEHALQLSAHPAYTIHGESIAPAETHRIALLRLDLEELRVETLLATGHAVDAEADAAALVDAEPFREHRWALLMRAQAAQQRTRDALGTFRRARNHFVSELGLEPGEELRTIERSLLFSDVEAQPEPPADSPLIEIPRAVGPLVGRTSEKERIERLLATGVPVAVIGPPGVGKTRLAIELARRAFDDGRPVAWIDLRTGALPVGAADLEEWARRSPGGLAVIDNAETAVGVAREVLDELTRVSAGLGVVITSRVPIDVSAAAQPLAPLALPNGDADVESSAAVRLLRSMLDLHAPRAAIDSSDAARLVRWVGGLPLAIRLVAESARSITPAEIMSASRSAVTAEIEAAVTWVLSRLDPATGRAFAALAFVPGDLDVGMAEALVGGSDARASLSTLCEHGLIQFEDTPTGATYSMLEPLRDLAPNGLTEAERDAVVQRMLAECVRRAESMAMPTRRREGEPAIEVRLRRELSWHRTAISWARRLNDDEPGLRIANGVQLGLYAVGAWRDLTALQDEALSIPGPPSGRRATLLADRGRPGPLHQLDEELLDAAIEMARETGDAVAEGRATYHLALRRWWLGQHEGAFELLARARELGKKTGNWFVETESVRFDAVVRVCAGEPERGFGTLCELLGRLETTAGLDLYVPHVRMYLGHCRRHVGDDDAAFADLDLARVEYESLGNLTSLVHIHAGLAEIAADREELDDVLRFAQRGLELAAVGRLTVYDPWLLATTARALAAVGDAVGARGASSAAIEAMSRSWIGETHRVAVELAAVALSLGDDDACVRLAGVADAWPDRRELPFKSPAEAQRLVAVRRKAAERRARTDDPMPTIALTLREAAATLIGSL